MESNLIGDVGQQQRSVDRSDLLEDFSSFGAALSWRIANRIWMQSDSHQFNDDVCWVLGLVDPSHDGMVSTTGVGRWSERTRFMHGADSELVPLAIIQMSSIFSNTMESQSWQQENCPTVISDWEEIYEADALGSTTVPCSILVNLFNHACGHKVRATLSTHNPQLWASIQSMLANMMLTE
eukprot:6484779-Amphidinium_carterae.1